MQFVTIYTQNPFKLITLIVDILIVMFLAYHILKIAKESRAWQLIKGITLLIIATWLSGLLNFRILNYILSAVMNWGVILLIIIFQPEIRRALEQLGTNKFTKLFGMEKDIATKTKEDIYKVAIAATELAKTKTGALIVLERDVSLGNYIDKAKKIFYDKYAEALNNYLIEFRK
jgi:diadenylate cyclase